MRRCLISPKHIALYGDVAELPNAVEAIHVACRTDVYAPAIVEQLVAAYQDIAHEVVRVEACSSIIVGEVVEDADVTCSLYADAVIATVLDDVAADDLSLAFCHWRASVHTVSETRLVFYEDAIVAATHADAVRYDEVLVLIASQSDADAAATTLPRSPVASALYHAYIIYYNAIEEVYSESSGRSATKHEVVEDSILDGAYVEGLTVGGVGGRLHLVAIDGKVFEADALDGWEVALLRAFSDEERPVARANHLENGALHRDTLQRDARTPMDGGAEDVLAGSKLN